MLSGLLRRTAIGASFGAILLAGGCSSDQPTTAAPPSGSPFPWLKTYPATYGHFYATAQSFGPKAPRYHVGGNIYASTSHTATINGGTMTAGNVTVNYESDGQYLSISRPTFGAVSTWGLAGNPTLGIPAFTDQMYVPAEINLISPLPSTSPLSRSQNIVLHWNPDPLNDSVAVYFEYDISTSQFLNTSNPSTDYGKFYIVSDNLGTFTIPAVDLAPLPGNCYLNIYVARGAGKLTGTPTKQFYIYGATTSSGLFRIIP